MTKAALGRALVDECERGKGHEKGGLEGEVGYFRRNHWVPAPQVGSLEELNEQLLAGCRADEAGRIAGHSRTVGEDNRGPK